MIYYITKRLFVSLQINLVNKCRFIYLSSAFAVLGVGWTPWVTMCASRDVGPQIQSIYIDPRVRSQSSSISNVLYIRPEVKGTNADTQMRSSFSSGDCVGCIQCDKIGEVNPLFIQNFGDLLCSISMGEYTEPFDSPKCTVFQSKT